MTRRALPAMTFPVLLGAFAVFALVMAGSKPIPAPAQAPTPRTIAGPVVTRIVVATATMLPTEPPKPTRVWQPAQTPTPRPLERDPMAGRYEIK